MTIFLFLVAGSVQSQSDEVSVKESFLHTIQKEFESLQAWGADEKAHPEKSLKYWEWQGKWHAFYDEYYDYTYDIQKTNSIVSPYIGIVTFKGRVFEKVGNSKLDCLNAEWKETYESTPTLRYAYQDRMWILKKVPPVYKKH